jgi:hypothetical protein
MLDIICIVRNSTITDVVESVTLPSDMAKFIVYMNNTSYF